MRTTWGWGATLLLAGCTCGGNPDLIPADAGDDAQPMSEDGGRGDDSGRRCEVRCGPSDCCTGDEECVIDRCLPPCEGSRCDDVCCGATELCVGGACIEPGVVCDEEGDCGADETCDPLIGRCIPLPPDAVCRNVPPVGVFEPEVQWAYDAEDSVSMPLVVQLTDDDGDGDVDARDMPDVVAITYEEDDDFEAESIGRLTALSGDDGHVLWHSPADVPLCFASTPAAGDLDGDGTIEIVALASRTTGPCTKPLEISGWPFTGNRVVAISHEGELEWRNTTEIGSNVGAVSIADLDGDGSPEVIAGGTVLTSEGDFVFEEHDLRDPFGVVWSSIPSIANVDDDPELEIIGPTVAVNHDGTTLWNDGVGQGVAFTAIAHLVDSSPGPQVVVVGGRTLEIRDAATGVRLLGPITYEPGGAFAGPPTVADFDGDGRPEIGVAGDQRFLVFDPDLPAPHILWSVASEDWSTGSVGSTVFDFDADGAAEVVYSDECTLRILSGRDGTLLWHATNTSWTSIEYPVVADVDADGNAELVVVGNAFSLATTTCPERTLPFSGSTRGVRVFRDVLDNWVATRAIWNEHAYHIDNVSDDGAIPMSEAPSWETHNSYRLNTLLDPSARTLAPDLVVAAVGGAAESCPISTTLRARVENRGSRGVSAGVPVAFYAGDPPDTSQLLGVGHTRGILLSGAGEWVELEAHDVPLDAELQLRFYAVADDDGTRRGLHSECDETNNDGSAAVLDCRIE